MYDVTLQHPALDERVYACQSGGELRTLAYGIARAQGQAVTDDRQMIIDVGDLRSQADIDGTGLLTVGEITIKVEPADPAALPRPRFGPDALISLTGDLDDAELEAAGGCGDCGLEADQMCAACGLCNCDRHDSCTRPPATSATPQ
ncbi:hypothetical protein RVR_4451 [Actinacidiphila reveromycinica]|uniref:Uncharacterized protein n=1 Tax=Actinacidiphila reveromycinica TaxID=659352 RepID=A0A7U3VP74_9ACTN|nr:hypothetical protein [Streptomyces sp. SN-593]BBA98314.1 hypothetical protein RVR_4451 [Streptomyces sp. SN-593]